MFFAAACLSSALLFQPYVSAFPTPRDSSRGTIYYPLTKGAAWVYEAGGKEVTHFVSEVADRKGRGAVVTVSWEDRPGQVVVVQKVFVTGDGPARPVDVCVLREGFHFDFVAPSGVKRDRERECGRVPVTVFMFDTDQFVITHAI